jgi:hypothetical protein
MTNFARSSLVLVLRSFFGGAKSCALVNFFMILAPAVCLATQATAAEFARAPQSSTQTAQRLAAWPLNYFCPGHPDTDAAPFAI